MVEEQYFVETGPRVTRAALAEVLWADELFGGLELAVDFGDILLQVQPEKDPNCSGIEFIVTVWSERALRHGDVLEGFSRVQRKLAERYGPMVLGEQPPALPCWH